MRDVLPVAYCGDLQFPPIPPISPSPISMHALGQNATTTLHPSRRGLPASSPERRPSAAPSRAFFTFLSHGLSECVAECGCRGSRRHSSWVAKQISLLSESLPHGLAMKTLRYRNTDGLLGYRSGLSPSPWQSLPTFCTSQCRGITDCYSSVRLSRVFVFHQYVTSAPGDTPPGCL